MLNEENDSELAKRITSGCDVAAEAELFRRMAPYTPPAGGRLECTVNAEDDFLIGRLTVDLSRAERVDLSLCDEAGLERARMRDVPFDREAGAVVFQQSIAYAKAAPSEFLLARVLAIEDEGAERVLGEFGFNHTRTIPG